MSESLDTVLVATSLDEANRKVTRVGLQVARASGARVALLHAAPLPVWYGDAPLAYMGQEGRVLKASVESLRETVAEEARQVGIEHDELVGCFLELAPPHRAVVALAHQLDAGLIVIGASDRPGGWHTLGSTTARVIQKSTRPVLVVRGALTLPLHRVLMAVDLSPLSGDALRCGLDRVMALSGEERPEIKAVFVLTPLERDGWPHFSGEQVDRFAHQELKRFLAEHTGDLGQPLRGEVRVGEPREAIAAEAEQWQPDLIVVGTHGRSGFERFVVGSVASDVLRRSKKNVLVVPPEAAARSALEAEEHARASGDWSYVSDEEPTALTT